MGGDPNQPVSIAEFDYRRICSRSGGRIYLTKLARSDDWSRLREALRCAAAGVVPQGKQFPRQVLWVAGATRRRDSPNLDLMAVNDLAAPFQSPPATPIPRTGYHRLPLLTRQ